MATTPLPEFERSSFSVPLPFDDDLDDPLNFGLSESPLAISTAVITGCTMLLLSDLVFRVVVRSKSGTISSNSVHRKCLLNQVINPFQWGSQLYKQVSSRRGQSKSSQSRLHMLEVLFVVAVGILFLVLELVLIFLATSRNQPTRVEISRIPSLTIADPGKRVIIRDSHDSCAVHPMTERTGYRSSASALTCIFDTYENRGLRYPENDQLIYIGLQQSNNELYILVDFEGSLQRTHIFLEIQLANMTRFRVRSAASHVVALDALISMVNLWGMIRTTNSSAVLEEGKNWEVGVTVDLRGVPKFVPTTSQLGVDLQDNLPKGFDWGPFWGVLTSSLFVVNSNNRALRPTEEFGDVYLGEGDSGDIISYTRPWISLGMALVLMVITFCVWLLVTFCLKWGGGVDERVAWGYMFCVFHGIGTFDFDEVNEIVELSAVSGFDKRSTSIEKDSSYNR